jgi:hypothetical protein
MKALLIKGGDELRKIFKELTNQVNSVQPENLQQKKMRLVFKKELFYEVKPSERIPSWVDTTFIFKENDYGEREIPISLPGHFFVNYEDLDRYNLPLFDKKDLEQIREYAEDEEDYELCAEIRDVIEKVG